MAMVKTGFHLLEGERGIVSRHVPVVIELGLGKAPESLDPAPMSLGLDVLVPFGATRSYLSLIAGVVCPGGVIGVVHTPSVSMRLNQRLQGLPLPISPRKDDHLIPSLVNAEDAMLAMSSSSPLSLTMAVEHRFVQLQFPGEPEGFQLFHRPVIDGLPEGAEDSLHGGEALRDILADAEGGYPLDEQVEQVAHHVQGDTQPPQVGPRELAEPVLQRA